MNYITYYDASLVGWESTNQEILIARSTDESKKNFDLNTLEVPTTFCYLKSFCKLKKGVHVMLKSDKTTALAYTNKKR